MRARTSATASSTARASLRSCTTALPIAAARSASQKLLASPYARNGRFDDEVNAAPRPASQPAEAGAFRTPGLREVSATAPYMHDGSIANLCDALQPHAALEGRPVPALTLAERRDLVAFLRTLGAQKRAVLIDKDAMICR